jgi:hypothetical protein
MTVREKLRCSVALPVDAQCYCPVVQPLMFLVDWIVVVRCQLEVGRMSEMVRD